VGLAKRLLAEDEERRSVAIGIAIRKDVLRVCEHHGEVFLPDEFVDPEPAYRNAAWRFRRGEFRSLFSSQQELTDEIKAAVNEFCWDECPLCYKLLKD
jgi:hypothetical protein